MEQMDLRKTAQEIADAVRVHSRTRNKLTGYNKAALDYKWNLCAQTVQSHEYFNKIDAVLKSKKYEYVKYNAIPKEYPVVGIFNTGFFANYEEFCFTNEFIVLKKNAVNIINELSNVFLNVLGNPLIKNISGRPYRYHEEIHEGRESFSVGMIILTYKEKQLLPDDIEYLTFMFSDKELCHKFVENLQNDRRFEVYGDMEW